MDKQTGLLSKTLVLVIIALLIGMSITPSVAVDTIEQCSMSTSNGNTLYVGGTEEGYYTRIQDAINDANDGDTVFVYNTSSSYFENVTGDKSTWSREYEENIYI